MLVTKSPKSRDIPVRQIYGGINMALLQPTFYK